MKNRENNFVSAVIYIYNNESIVSKFIEELNFVLSENFKKFEIICVNDCSDDKSVENIRKSVAKMGNGTLILVNTSFYQGLESSMVAGVDFASGDFVFEFDSVAKDYDMSTIMEVYNHCLTGSDIVGASTSAKQQKTSSIFYSIFNKYSNMKYKIQTESFRILSRRAINQINKMSITTPYRKAVYANCGLRYDNIVYDPILSLAPIKLKSEYRQGLAIDSLIVFTDIAYKISLILTIIMMSMSVIVGVYTVSIFLSNDPAPGWTTTMVLLSFGFFGLFSILSIVIKYLSVIVNLIFKKTKYVVGNIEKL